MLAATLFSAVAAAVPSTSVGVGLDEFTLSLGRRTAVPGYVKLNVTNTGEDPHDLVLLSPKRRVLVRTAVLQPGERASVRYRLRAEQTVRLVCTLVDHERRGMRATLRIRKTKKRTATSPARARSRP